MIRTASRSARLAYVCTGMGIKPPNIARNTGVQMYAENGDASLNIPALRRNTAESYTFSLMITQVCLTYRQGTAKRGKKNMTEKLPRNAPTSVSKKIINQKTADTAPLRYGTAASTASRSMGLLRAPTMPGTPLDWPMMDFNPRGSHEPRPFYKAGQHVHHQISIPRALASSDKKDYRSRSGGYISIPRALASPDRKRSQLRNVCMLHFYSKPPKNILKHKLRSRIRLASPPNSGANLPRNSCSLMVRTITPFSSPALPCPLSYLPFLQNQRFIHLQTTLYTEMFNLTIIIITQRIKTQAVFFFIYLFQQKMF